MKAIETTAVFDTLQKSSHVNMNYSCYAANLECESLLSLLIRELAPVSCCKALHLLATGDNPFRHFVGYISIKNVARTDASKLATRKRQQATALQDTFAA